MRMWGCRQAGQAEELLDERHGGAEMAEGEERMGQEILKTIWLKEGKLFPDTCWFVELGRRKCAEGI